MSKLSGWCGLRKLLQLPQGSRRHSQRDERALRESDDRDLRRPVFGEDLRSHDQRNQENCRHRRVRDLMCRAHAFEASVPLEQKTERAGLRSNIREKVVTLPAAARWPQS
jgi:hypothetical protein